MRYFNYQSLSELQQNCAQLKSEHLKFEPDPERVKSALFSPVNVGGFKVGNAIAIHPMEGCDGTLDGSPDELTWRRYERFAAGGAKVIWFEATAVCPEGRANTRQLWIKHDNLNEFARLLARIREVHATEFGTADDLLIPIQLTHSGRYSVQDRLLAYHHPSIDARTGTPPDAPVVSDGELERLEDQYVEAAGLALAAGFGAIDLKVTHGYLLSELMGAKLRPGRYGGPVENRTRFARNVFGKIRAKFGRQLLLGMRLGCFDGVPYRKRADGVGEPYPFDTPYPYGFGVAADNPLREDLTDVKQAIQLYREAGLELLNVSIGCPYYNPHVTRPFESPDDGNYLQPEHPLLGVDRHFRIAGELQQAFPDLPMVGTGYSWLQIYAPNAGAWNVAHRKIHFFGVGRGALAYPDFPNALAETGQLDQRRVCKTLTYCTFLMRQKTHPLGQFPTGCPPFDKEVYGPIMKDARAMQRAAK
jgi:NADPH2 dehydrogenase